MARRELTDAEKSAIRANVDAVFARLIGVVAGLIGIAAMALAGLASYKVYLLEHRAPGFVLIAVFLVIGVFFFLVGWRLLLNRPNRYGSVLSPVGWRVLGILFAVVGIGLFAFFVGTMTLTLDTISTTAVPVIASAIFSYWCFRSASRARANAGAGAL
jgi:hypothetical protein